MQTDTITTAPAAAPTKRTGRRPRARTVGRWLLIITLAVMGATIAAGQIAKARLLAQHPPVGQLVDIGGYRLHLFCQGSGDQTVILEAGGGEPLLDWALVQPEVAKGARVCAYDRGGLGWSDPSPRPRTAAVMAEELHTLLERAQVPGPYILVGHSLGGLVVRQFALAHPHDVAGMVLVESASEGQYRRFSPPVQELTGNRSPMPRVLAAAADAGLLALVPAIYPTAPQLPAETAAAFQALNVTSGKAIRAALDEANAMNADLAPRPETLGDIPLVVLRRTRPILPIRGPITEAVSQEYEQTWAQMQQELVTLSPQGRMIVAEGSGHALQLDRPDLVVAAINEMLSAAR